YASSGIRRPAQRRRVRVRRWTDRVVVDPPVRRAGDPRARLDAAPAGGAGRIVQRDRVSGVCVLDDFPQPLPIKSGIRNSQPLELLPLSQRQVDADRSEQVIGDMSLEGVHPTVDAPATTTKICTATRNGASGNFFSLRRNASSPPLSGHNRL